MHANSLKNLKPWQPGQSGYAGRGNKLPENLRGISSLTQLEITKLISKYARMNVDELSAAKEEKLSVLELAFISIFEKSMEDGDFSRLAFLLDRCIGKAPTVVEDGEASEELDELKKLSLNQLVKLVQSNLPEATER